MGVFGEWFHGEFVQSVRKFRRKNKPSSEKALLLIDLISTIRTKGTIFRTLFLPGDVRASLLQPPIRLIADSAVNSLDREKFLIDVKVPDGFTKFYVKQLNMADTIFTLIIAIPGTLYRPIRSSVCVCV